MLEEYEQYFSETLLEKSIIDIAADEISGKFRETRNRLAKKMWDGTKKFLGFTFKRMFFAALSKVGSNYGKEKHNAIREGRKLYRNFSRLHIETLKLSKDLYNLSISAKIFGSEKEQQEHLQSIFDFRDPPDPNDYANFIDDLVEDIPQYRDVATRLKNTYKERFKKLQELISITQRLKSQILKPANVNTEILDNKIKEIVTFGMSDESPKSGGDGSNTGSDDNSTGRGQAAFNPARAMTRSPSELTLQQTHEVVQHIQRLLNDNPNSRTRQAQLKRWQAALDSAQQRAG